MDTDNSNNSQPNKKFSGKPAWILYSLIAVVVILFGFVIYQQGVNSRLSNDLMELDVEEAPGTLQTAPAPTPAATPPGPSTPALAATPPVNTVAEKPSAPAVRTYSNVRAAKAAYQAGTLNKSEYKSIVKRLTEEKEQKINRVKADYKSGKISKSQSKDRIAAIKSQY